MNKLNLKLSLLLTVLIVSCAASGDNQQPNIVKERTPDSLIQELREQRLATVENDIELLLAQMTLEEKVSLVHANSKFAISSIERLGIHEMWMSDGPHGVREEISRDSWNSAGWTDDYSTYLPPLTMVAASWNPEMATLHGGVLGSEARHRRKDVILGPGVNLARLPLYGRNFEYLGEDPYLASALVVPEIKAIQNNDVAANVKHYALNTQELNRTGVDARPDERTLREVYLPAFEAAVKEGDVYTVMGAYNNVYGTNANQSKQLIDILKEEWGFQHVLLTDWDVNINTDDAALNGLDIEMGTKADSYDDYRLANPFLAKLKSGEIPVSVVDDKVRRILRVQLKIGMMDRYRQSGQRNVQQHRDAARKIAEQGIVLLKNEDRTLPLDKTKIKKILVLGPNADKQHARGGGSSQVKSLWEVTPLQGLRQKLGEDVEVEYMRVRASNSLLPIAGDYIVSRHRSTGTPAWQEIIWDEPENAGDFGKGKKHWGWRTDSSYSAPIGSGGRGVILRSEMRPLASGTHTFKVQGVNGKFAVKLNQRIDGNAQSSKLQTATKTLFDGELIEGETFSHEIELDNQSSYFLTLQFAGKGHVTLGWDAPGNPYQSKLEYMAAAKEADAVVFFGGLSHADDRESMDRVDMKLPNFQDEIIENLLTANPKTIVFLTGGSAVEMPWSDRAKSIVWGWYAGMEGGHAFADVLFGSVNPSGKLPITMPEKLEDVAAIALDDYNDRNSLYKEGVFIGYRWFEQHNITPLFPFGHGLSYTAFEYSDLELSSDSIRGESTVTVTANVHNIGDTAGFEVVQLYLNDEMSSVKRPLKELKGFDKVWIEPGETQQVSFTLKKRDLSFWDIKTKNWLAEDGKFNVMLGASVTDIRLTSSFHYQSK